MAISPELSTSLENSGSGVLGELLMSQVITSLGKELQPAENFKFDLLYILTPTGSLNHEATGKFLEHLQSNIKERIKFAICLDSLTDQSTATPHLYVVPGEQAHRDATAKQYIKEFEKATKRKNIKTEVKDASFAEPSSKNFL